MKRVKVLGVAASLPLTGAGCIRHWILAVVLLAGGYSHREPVVTDGLSVLEVLPTISRGGDVYGTGSRNPLSLTREIVDGRAYWNASYTEQVGQEKKHVLRTVRIGPDGEESVLSSEPLDRLVFGSLWSGMLKNYLLHSGRNPASVSRVDFKPSGANGVVWFGNTKVKVTDALLWDLSLPAFRKLVATADRIVIRDGGQHDCCGAKIDEQPILAELTDPSEISAFNAMLEFSVPENLCFCACCGHPGVDWWKDGKRIVLSSVHHGRSFRWSGFPCDAQFSPASAKTLSEWFEARGLGRHWRDE